LAVIHYIYDSVRSVPPWELKAKVKALIQKALEIDDSYALTYSPLGRSMINEYDWQGAEKSYKRALELNPGHSDSHAGYSHYLGAVGRLNEAIVEIKHAVELDPLSSWNRAFFGFYLIWMGQFEEAVELSQETLELDPNNPWVMTTLSWAYAGKGMYNKAISTIQGLRNISFFAAYLGYFYGKADRKKEAQKILDDFLDRSRQGYFSPYMIAQVYSGLGEYDKVLEWLEKAYEVKDPGNFIIKIDIPFHSLHSDPRWAEQLKKRGLAD
jgi:tetratricopeptide (TPR) repeat protein